MNEGEFSASGFIGLAEGLLGAPFTLERCVISASSEVSNRYNISIIIETTNLDLKYDSKRMALLLSELSRHFHAVSLAISVRQP